MAGSRSNAGFDRSIDVMDAEGGGADDDAQDDGAADSTYGRRKQYTASRAFFDEAKGDADDDPLAHTRPARVIDRETDYQKRRLHRQLSPERADPFADAPASGTTRSFQEVYEESRLTIEQDNVMKNIARKQADADLAAQAIAEAKAKAAAVHAASSSDASASSAGAVKKRRRWDVGTGDDAPASSSSSSSSTFSSVSETPRYVGGADATPAYGGGTFGGGDETPAYGGKRASSWGETPLIMGAGGVGATPTSNFGATPAHGGLGAGGLRAPSTPLEVKRERLKSEFDQRNRELTDEVCVRRAELSLGVKCTILT